MDLLLTPQEQERFASWCEHEAQTLSMLTKQAEMLGAVGEALVKRNRTEAMAFAIVARVIRSTHSESIG
jgi:hypothetical protein